jgi:hypothetical protein
VARFVSMYKNRVFSRRQGSRGDWIRAQTLGLNERSDLNEFIDKFESYKAVMPDISHHSTPQSDFSGHDANFYGLLFLDTQVTKFEELVSEIRCKKTVVPLLQTIGNSVSVMDLSDSQRAKVRALHQQDYRTFHELLSEK